MISGAVSVRDASKQARGKLSPVRDREETMERKRSSSSSSSQPPYGPCQRAHNFFSDPRNPPHFNYSHFTPYSYPQVNLGKNVYRQRFQKAVKSSPKPGNEDDSAHSDNITPERAPKNSSAKVLLYELCAAYKWKPPLFDCHREEGPSHRKQFVFKVVVEIGGNPASVVEAFSEPKSSKKSAAEHAAEGALWYLKRLSYFPKRK